MMREGARRLLAPVGLVTLAVALVSALPAREFHAVLFRPPAPSSASSFDPAYGAFLREVAAATERDASVALVVPRGELYVYAAAYELAPRRVLFGAGSPGASVVAVYGSNAPPPPDGARKQTIPHGLLYRP